MSVLLSVISIEPMRVSDIEEVRAIDARCYPSAWSHNAYVTELSNRSATYLVAREGDTIVGVAGQWTIMDEAHITTLAIDPSRQGRKIGERLLIALLDIALQSRATHVTLEVRESNRVAQALYKKYGFKAQALRKNYYTDTVENAVVMWASDIHLPLYQQFLEERRNAIEALYRQRLSS